MAMRSRSLHSSLLIFFSSLVLGAAPASPASEVARSSSQASVRVAPVGMDLLPSLQRATDVGPANPERVLSLCVSMPYARPEAMQAFVDSVSNPRSPNYREFITPQEVGERFGLPIDQVNQVVEYLRGHGFSITLVSKNHTTVLANATVAQAEAAFHTSLREYTLVPQDSVEPSRFIAYSTPVQLPPSLAPLVIDVSGLETYTRPQPRTTLLTPSLTRGLYNTVGMFTNGFTGAGRTIAISNWDGFRSADWLNYINHFGLPVPAGGAGSNIAVIPCGGGGAGAGPPAGEGDLDIQMELGMAPLADIKIYDGNTSSNLTAVLAQEVNDNLADVISESWGWALSGNLAVAAHNSHLSMSAQGITYMAASGDSGTSIEPYSYPDFEPEVLSVGGTRADVNSPSGSRISEIYWSGSGGGWSTHTNVFNVRPSWQTGTGVPPVNATNNHRLIPDLAVHSAGAGTGAYEFYTNGALDSGSTGTSFASPIFAGCLGIIEQNIISQGGLPPNAAGKRRFGRIQDLIYSQNGRSDVWFDMFFGSNGNLPDGSPSTCQPGWDTVTGWGAIDCGAFASVAACSAGCEPGTRFCAGDSVDPNVTTPCPCSNFGQLGRGCANSSNANGALLTASGSAIAGTVVLSSAGELPSALSIFLQGTTSVNTGILHGDGVRCVDGNLKKLYVKNAALGSVSAPGAGDQSIPRRSAALGDVIPPGATRYYQVYYRDPNVGFCPSATHNISSGFFITWP